MVNTSDACRLKYKQISGMYFLLALVKRVKQSNCFECRTRIWELSENYRYVSKTFVLFSWRFFLNIALACTFIITLQKSVFLTGIKYFNPVPLRDTLFRSVYKGIKTNIYYGMQENVSKAKFITLQCEYLMKTYDGTNKITRYGHFPGGGLINMSGTMYIHFS